MKKIILILTSIFAFGLLVNAQNFVLIHNNETVTDSSEITVTEIDAWGTMACHFLLKNVASKSLDIYAKSDSIAFSTGTSHAFCMDECKNGFPSFGPISLASQDTLKGISCDYIPVTGTSSTAKAMYTFYSNAGEDTVRVFVVYNYTHTTGISGSSKVESTMSAFPNPASSKVTINYSVNNATVNPKLLIKNILGNTVKEIQLNSFAGKAEVMLDDLTSGMYFYSLQHNSQIISTKKLVIKR